MLIGAGGALIGSDWGSAARRGAPLPVGALITSLDLRREPENTCSITD